MADIPEIKPKRGKWRKGESGNPKGRPPGIFSIKTLIQRRLEANPKELDEVIKYFIKENRELMWQMLEGRPPQDVDMKHNAGESLIEILKNVNAGYIDLSYSSPKRPCELLPDGSETKPLAEGKGDNGGGAGQPGNGDKKL